MSFLSVSGYTTGRGTGCLLINSALMELCLDFVSLSTAVPVDCTFRDRRLDSGNELLLL